MTQFKSGRGTSNTKSNNVYDKAIWRFIKILHHEMPSCHCWDDFLDFSRMSLPNSVFALFKRLRFGSFRFAGNYVYICFFTFLCAGLMISKRYLLPFTILPLLWVGICHLTSIDDQKGGIDYLISLDERILLMVGLGHLVLFVMNVLVHTYILFTVVTLVNALHSSMRPVMCEIVKPKAKVVASDGFIDEFYKGEEVTMIFTRSDSPDNDRLKSATLKHRQNLSYQNVKSSDGYY